MVELGIITVRKDANLPNEVYDMPELQNTDGGLTVGSIPDKPIFRSILLTC